ncbi:MAG: hypothetical protein IIC60_12350, partial [Proteobacteria bacterium]|nr:hypothetical protein [Pseudomonadota bacterium]
MVKCASFGTTFTGYLLTLLLVFGTYHATTAIASESEKIRIISTNDIHSYLRPIYYRYQDEPKPWGIQSVDGRSSDKTVSIKYNEA